MTAAATTERPPFRYIPAFDGVRGYLVLVGPLLYHGRPESIAGGLDIVRGGILSIDLFFVMSSYLIVSIALREWDATGRINLVAYAGRRVRRLLPALLVAVGFLSIYLAIIDDPALVDRWTGAIVSALTYSANWHEILSGVSYFENFSTPSPLRHVWSFSIEEQFYVFAPLFLIAGLKWGGRRGRQILLAVSISGALASAWWMARVNIEGEDPSRAYFGTDTRAQALFVGIALAIAVHLHGPPRSDTGRRLAALIAYPAMGWHLWAVINVSESDPWLFEKGGFLLVALVGAAAMFGLSQDAPWSPLHSFLTLRPFRYAGRISYGLYLYHWPIYLLVTQERAGTVFGVDRVSGASLLAVHLTLTFIVAAASFHLIEQPFVRGVWPFSTRRLTLAAGGFAAATTIVVVLGGLLVAHTRRPPEPEVVLIPAPVEAAVDELGASPAESRLDDAADSISNDGAAEAIGDDGEAGAPLRILTVGDSVMDQIGVALIDWTLENPDAALIVFNEAHIGCGTVREGEKRVPEGDVGPVGDVCSDWADPVDVESASEYNVVSWPTVLDVFQPDIVVTYISAWDVLDRKIPSLGDEWTYVGMPDFDEYAMSEFEAAVNLLTSTGAELFILEGADLNRPIVPQNSPERIQAMNELVAAVVAEAQQRGIPVSMVDFPEWVGEVGSELELHRRDDGVHLSDDGLVEVVPWLLDDVLGLELSVS